MRGVELTQALYEYVVKVGVRETPVQRQLRRATRRLPMAGMQIGADQGALLQILVRLLGAKRCIEVGTFTGYSAPPAPKSGRRPAGASRTSSPGWAPAGPSPGRAGS